MNSSKTIVDVIESALGGPLTTKLMNRPRPFNDDVRKRISFAHYQYEKGGHWLSPERSTTEIFPFIHPGWDAANHLGGGVVSNVDSVTDSIKLLLLYYHRLAIPDRFGYFCDIYRLGPGTVINQQRFDDYLRLFAQLRPLIQDGTVFFAPEPLIIKPAQDAIENSGVLERMYEKLSLDVRDTVVPQLDRNFEEAFWIKKHFDLDILIPDRRASKYFERYLEQTAASLSKQGLLEAKVGSELLECRLPKLDKLDLKDIISIRNNSDNFAAWVLPPFLAASRSSVQATIANF